MSSTIFMGLVLVFAVALLIGAIYVIGKLLGNFSPSQRKVNADLKAMQEKLEPVISKLVPWEREEMELFSLNQTDQVVEKGLVDSARGVFTSIYHEPMLAYAYKDYVTLGKKKDALLYAKTALHEYVYRIKGDEIKVMADGTAIGVIRSDGTMYAPGRKNKAIASVKRNPNELLLPVLVGDREVAAITNPANTSQPNPRAFDLISDDITPDEEKIFLSLAILEIISQN